MAQQPIMRRNSSFASVTFNVAQYGQKVMPSRLLDSGFIFNYADDESALQNLG